LSENSWSGRKWETVEDIQANVYELFVKIEENPDRKGQITLEWLQSIPPEMRLLRFSVYGIAKERQMSEINNFNISGQVGNLNLGEQYGAVTNTLTQLAGNGEKQKEVASALRALVEGVRSSSSLTDPEKADLLEGLNALGEQAKEEKPKRFTVAALLKSLPEALKVTSALSELWAAHGPTVITYFHHLLNLS
jgi:hypothetical protein